MHCNFSAWMQLVKDLYSITIWLSTVLSTITRRANRDIEVNLRLPELTDHKGKSTSWRLEVLLVISIDYVKYQRRDTYRSGNLLHQCSPIIIAQLRSIWGHKFTWFINDNDIAGSGKQEFIALLHCCLALDSECLATRL